MSKDKKQQIPPPRKAGVSPPLKKSGHPVLTHHGNFLGRSRTAHGIHSPLQRSFPDVTKGIQHSIRGTNLLHRLLHLFTPTVNVSKRAARAYCPEPTQVAQRTEALCPRRPRLEGHTALQRITESALV